MMREMLFQLFPSCSYGSDQPPGKIIFPEIIEHLMLDIVPEILRYGFVYAYVAHNGKLPASDCQVDKYPIPVQCFAHTKMLKKIGRPVEYIPFQGVFDMDADLSGGFKLRFGNCSGYCLLLILSEEVPGCCLLGCLSYIKTAPGELYRHPVQL